MSLNPCRDCGYLLAHTARGCPRCAMNIEAEAKIEHFIWRRLLPCVLAVMILGAGALIWWRLK